MWIMCVWGRGLAEVSSEVVNLAAGHQNGSPNILCLFFCLLQEIFGPVLSVYVYPEKNYKEVLQLIDNTSPYALTGAVFAQDK